MRKVEKTNKAVLVWMKLGLLLIFLQIIIGGVTRLTGSGLSITKWEIVTGTIPPLSESAWDKEFEAYQQTPQFQKINRDFTLSEFKFIYFWEYFHRLWARMMGFVFVFPLIVFLWKEWIPRNVLKRLIVVFVLAGLAAIFGWIMVASGLSERPWVNAYKLSIHLALALLVLGYLLWTYLLTRFPLSGIVRKRSTCILLVMISAQIFLGALVSGMKAALVYPTFPDYDGKWIPAVLTSLSNWSVDNLVYYDKSAFAPALIQFAHRNLAYVLIISVLYVFFREKWVWKRKGMGWPSAMLIILLIIQIILGVSILVNSIGSIPVASGVLHQAVGILILCTALYLHYFNINSTDPLVGDQVTR